MHTWAPLWSGIVDSSIWDEPDFVVKIFLTMVALKDADHIYRGSAYALATRSKKPENEVMEALRILSSPDTLREQEQPYEGRRIKLMEEGWLILNGEKYRAMVQLEMKRARLRRAQKAFRERKKFSIMTRVEAAYAKAVEEDNLPEQDRLTRTAEDENLKKISQAPLSPAHPNDPNVGLSRRRKEPDLRQEESGGEEERTILD